MAVHHTAHLTAMWRHMAKVDPYALEHLPYSSRMLGYVMGTLDPNSVETIRQRTTLIDTVIRTKKPSTIVEIGSGLSSRKERFPECRVINLDVPQICAQNAEVEPFMIAEDVLDLEAGNALFIVEGVTMYLRDGLITELLREIKRYGGQLLIDFFNREFSSTEKKLNEKFYKVLMRKIVGKKEPFSFRIENLGAGISMLIDNGYRQVEYLPYNIAKSLDALFYAEF